MKPYMCPICLGKGIVHGGFYNSLPGCPGTSSNTTEMCRSCGGSGIVYGTEYTLQGHNKLMDDWHKRIDNCPIEELMEKHHIDSFMNQDFTKAIRRLLKEGEL